MYLRDFLTLKPFHNYSLCSVCILPQSAFYSQSAVCILHSVCILPLVRSLQSAVFVLHWPILNHLNNKELSYFRVNWNIFVFKLLQIHTRGRSFRNIIQLTLDAFCLPAKQNRTNRVDWVRLVRLSLVIELTEKFQFDYQTNRTKIRPIGFDWVRLIFGSVPQFQIPNFKFQFSLGHLPFFCV